MKNLKMKIAASVIAAVLGVSSSAHAFFIVAIPTAVVTNNAFDLDIGDMSGQEMFVCALFLPLCILGEKGEVQGQGPLMQQDLIANGYSVSEASNLVDETHELTKILNEKHQRIVISNQDSEETVAQGVRQIMPSASDLLVEFLIDSALK